MLFYCICILNRMYIIAQSRLIKWVSNSFDAQSNQGATERRAKESEQHSSAICKNTNRSTVLTPFIMNSTGIYFPFFRNVDSFNWKFYVLIWLSWNVVGLLSKLSKQWMNHYFSLLHMFKGDNWHAFWFDNNCNVGFLAGTVLWRSLKLCMTNILFRVYHVILGLLTLT